MKPVERALWFIESHSAGDISLADIATAAGVSQFHMVRAFGLGTGRSVMRYLRARRLSEAAKALARGAPDILSVALEAGYGSHEAFTRAFRDQFGVTPDAVRAAGTVAHLCLQEPITMDPSARPPRQLPRIEDGKGMVIAGLSQRHAFDNLGGLPAQWQQFGPHLGHVPNQVGQTCYGVCYHTDEAGFDYLTGVEVRSVPGLPPEFAHLRLDARRYAVFTHADHVALVRATFMAIFDEWLPASGHQPADAPVFERYDHRFDGRTGLGGFEIWVPVRT